MKKTFNFTPLAASFIWTISIIVRIYVKNDHAQNSYTIKAISEGGVEVPDEISVDYVDEIEALIDSTIDEWYNTKATQEVEVVAEDPTAAFDSHAEYLAWVYDNSEAGGLNETARKARQSKQVDNPYMGFGPTDTLNAALDTALPIWMSHAY